MGAGCPRASRDGRQEPLAQSFSAYPFDTCGHCSCLFLGALRQRQGLPTARVWGRRRRSSPTSKPQSPHLWSVGSKTSACKSYEAHVSSYTFNPGVSWPHSRVPFPRETGGKRARPASGEAPPFTQTCKRVWGQQAGLPWSLMTHGTKPSCRGSLEGLIKGSEWEVFIQLFPSHPNKKSIKKKKETFPEIALVDTLSPPALSPRFPQISLLGEEPLPSDLPRWTFSPVS